MVTLSSQITSFITKDKNAGKLDKNQRRVHMNNRVNDVSIICYTEFYVNLFTNFGVNFYKKKFDE